jgi:hypothetical protein
MNEMMTSIIMTLLSAVLLEPESFVGKTCNMKSLEKGDYCHSIF